MATSKSTFVFTDEFKANFVIVQKVPTDNSGDPTMTVDEWMSERILMWLNEQYENGKRQDAKDKIVYETDVVSIEKI